MRQQIIALTLLIPVSLASGDDLKDPTRPPVVAGANSRIAVSTAMVVTAIFMSGERRIAVVNDEPVRVGDFIGSHQILEINAAGVRYSSGGRSVFARLVGHADRVGE
jgi:hypothetical protein